MWSLSHVGLNKTLCSFKAEINTKLIKGKTLSFEWRLVTSSFYLEKDIKDGAFSLIDIFAHFYDYVSKSRSYQGLLESNKKIEVSMHFSKRIKQQYI